MGNQPPSNGSSRDDHHPGSVIPPHGVMGSANGQNAPTHHGHGDPSSAHGQGQGYDLKQPQQQQQFPPQHHQQHHHGGPPPNHLATGSTGYNHQNNSAMHESNSDASMSNVEDGNNSSSNTTNPNHKDSSASASTKQQNFQLTLASLAAADDDTVPTVFRWEHGGRQVYITGTFNGWSRQIPMHRSGNDFTYIHNLKRGKHAFKFIVDDEWRFAPDQPTVADIEGRINNFIDVTDFKPYTGDKDFEREKAAAYYSVRRSVPVQDGSDTNNNPGGGGANNPGGGGANNPGGNNAGGTTGDGSNAAVHDTFTDPDGEVFTHNMPDLDEYTKDPPPLPPHLRHIILNKPPQLSDTAALPVPQHVALNHLYCTAIKDNMMVLGITQRFRTKFVTTVYYSPELAK